MKGSLTAFYFIQITLQCENTGKLSYYYHSDTETCYEHFTKGPCQGTGELFLPDGNCGCNPKLPHFHTNTHQCYEIGTYEI